MNYRNQMLFSASPRFYPADGDPAPAADPKPADPAPAADPKPADPAPAADPKPAEEPPAIPKEEPTLLADKPKEGDPKKDEPKEGDPKPAAVPEAYELKAPEGVDLDPAMVELATPVFKELGLDNAAAQKVVSLYAEQVMPALSQHVTGETLKLLGMGEIGKWVDQIKADKDIGGAKFEETMTLAAAGRDKFATPELKAFFETSRIGNHPEMIRFFAAVGKAIGEGSMHRDNNGGGVRTGAEAFYDPAFSPKT